MVPVTGPGRKARSTLVPAAPPTPRSDLIDYTDA